MLMLQRARPLPAEHRAFTGLPVTYHPVGRADESMAVHVAGTFHTSRPPVVCLAGLQRNMADFGDFAGAFRRAIGYDWPVVLIDLKGRGRSADRHDRARYISPMDAGDVAQVLAALALDGAVFVGQGYGGQVVMALAEHYANLIIGAVLIDAGPVSDPRGLVRLRNNLKDLDGNRSEAGFRAMFRRMLAADYPSVPEALLDVLAARTHFLDRRGRVKPLFDPRVTAMLDDFEHDDILVPQWQLFEALGNVPLLLMRTQLTDQLRRETFEEMLRRRQDAAGYIIEGQGSPALLNTPEDVTPIAEFVRAIAKRKGRPG